MFFDKKSIYPEYNVRRSQLLTPFGIGALMDINNQSIMIADSEYWDSEKCTKIHDIRLEQEMKANGFIEPPVVDEDEIVGKRFPSWYFSPNDRSLKKIEQWREKVEAQGVKSRINAFNRKPFDPETGSELVPVRIICACKNGHAQDFPWLEWAHKDLEFNEFKHHEIKLESVAQSGSIADLVVACKTCNRKRSLEGIFNENTFPKKLEEIGVKCEGKFRWRKHFDEGSLCDEKENLKVLLRNANNFFFPNISSSVNIPFKKNRLIEEIKKSKYYSELEEELATKKSLKGASILETDDDIKFIIRLMSKKINGYSVEEIKSEIAFRFFSEKKVEVSDSIMDYRRAEFDVLTGRKGFDCSSERFKIQQFQSDKFSESSYKTKVEEITLVHQLEVVSALRSYSRIEPTDSELMRERMLEENEDDINMENRSKEISLKRKDGYYVGMSFLGEGIFFSLNVEEVLNWMSKIEDTKIFERIIRKKNNVRFQDELPYVSPDYYLIHTLSHILIKELSISCGYSSSALKERIYFSNKKGEEMYGILIYTSSSDSEGTLGGLVRQGVPEKFFELLESALEKANWCSFDPICIESASQGRDSLNAAACHACCLISETSCEKMNVFLDRSVLIGSLDNPSLGFFNTNINENDISENIYIVDKGEKFPYKNWFDSGELESELSIKKMSVPEYLESQISIDGHVYDAKYLWVKEKTVAIYKEQDINFKSEDIKTWSILFVSEE